MRLYKFYAFFGAFILAVLLVSLCDYSAGHGLRLPQMTAGTYANATSKSVDELIYAQFSDANTPAEIDLRVGGIGTGSSYHAVIKQFGKPLRREKIEDEWDIDRIELSLSYPGLTIGLLSNYESGQLEVYAMEITSPKWRASGISLGAEIKDVTAKFGGNYSRELIDGEVVLFYGGLDDSGAVNFYFRAGKLVKMAMGQDSC